MNPEFLDVDDVLELPFGRDSRARWLRWDTGPRSPEIRHRTANASFGDEFLHQDIFEMAAALHFSLVSNHPFIDGNKRTGLAAMLVFLELNGYSFEEPRHMLVEITLAVASGSMSKVQVAQLLRECAAQSDSGY